jgi:hypothetical protein
MPELDRDHYRWQTANRLKSLHKHSTLTSNLKGQTEMKTLKNTKKKLGENHAIITNSDKGNSIVIITVDEYNQKLHDFIATNNFNLIRS